MDEKLRFVAECLRESEPMTVLCARFGISRDTGYKWKGRYAEAGVEGLKERSRAPHRHPQALSGEIAERILELRRARPYWGPRKLVAYLADEEPGTEWPAASTAGDLLRREGLSEPRKRRRRAVPVDQPFRTVSGPNDVWCIDFKGWFRTRDGERCDPLTVSDAYSRYLLLCEILPTTIAGVQGACERLFRERGLPGAIRSDNGTPFAGTGAGGLSRLSVWWIKLGIGRELIEPGAPQQNGRHERMHRTLKGETTRPPAASAREQQARFDAFRHDFNEIRPHEALGQEPPARHYQASTRPFPERLEEPWYDADHAVRRVRPTGEIRWAGNLVFISEALAGEPVGVAELGNGSWIVRFADIDLGLIDRRTNKLHRFGPGRPPRSKTTQDLKVSGM